MKQRLLIGMLLSGWTAWAQAGTPQNRGESLYLARSMGYSERNDRAHESMAVDGLKRRLIGGNTGAGVDARNALTDIPSSSLICFLGNYADMTNKAVLFAGGYNDLTRRPSTATSMSSLINDADYQTEEQVGMAIQSDTLSASPVATTSATKSVSAPATQALTNQGGGATASSYTIQYRATSVNTASGTNQTLTHNFGPNTGIDRIVAYELNTRVSVDMPFDTGSVTDAQVTIQPLATTTYTAIVVIGHKLQ